jgi:hypothetical protein
MANVLKMAAVADIVTLNEADSSDRRISALLSLDRETEAQTLEQDRQIPGEIILRTPKTNLFVSTCYERREETTQGREPSQVWIDRGSSPLYFRAADTLLAIAGIPVLS